METNELIRDEIVHNDENKSTIDDIASIVTIMSSGPSKIDEEMLATMDEDIFDLM